MNLGKPGRGLAEPGFLLIWGAVRGEFEKAPQPLYSGVTGTIGSYWGCPEIILKEPPQIKLEQACPLHAQPLTALLFCQISTRQTGWQRYLSLLSFEGEGIDGAWNYGIASERKREWKQRAKLDSLYCPVIRRAKVLAYFV